MRRSLYASSAIHAAILIWVAIGDGLFKDSPDPVFEVTGVTILSTAEFDALTATPTPVALDIPPPPARPEPLPEPEPAPEPEPEPEPEPQPEPTPPGDVTDTLAPPAPLSGTPDLPQDGRPTPRAADRIAPLPAPAPEPEVEAAPEAVTQSTAPTPSATPVEEAPEAAPEEATTEIVTEAETPSGGPLGPVASIRPPTRPERPRPPETPVELPELQPETTQQPEEIAENIDSLLSELVFETPPTLQSGTQILSADVEKGLQNQIRSQVQPCWNTGALSTEAQGTTVVVEFEMTPEGRLVDGSLRFFSSEGGGSAAAQQAYEAARRAILRCGSTGFGLPAESYDYWRQIRMPFNPEGMRLR
jgi:hypothetical protein